MIEFLSAGKVSSDHQDFKDLQYKTLLHKISTCDRPNEFMHSFKLSSAYENIMPFTNYTCVIWKFSCVDLFFTYEIYILDSTLKASLIIFSILDRRWHLSVYSVH